MAKKIRFTKFGTVLLDDKEMSEKTFWERLEDNINDDDYKVSFDEKNSEFTIYFDGYLYKVELTDKEHEILKKGMYSSLVKRLMALSHIKKLSDASSSKTLKNSDTLDKDTNEYYLRILRKDNKFTINDIRRYFKNLIEDIKDSWDDTIYFVENLDSEIICWFMFLGLVVSVTLGATIVGIPTEEEKGMIAILEYSGLAIGGVVSPFILTYPISFLSYNVRYRVERLMKKINTKKLNNVKIKKLESIILEEEKKITDQVPLLPSNDKSENFNMLSLIIDRLLDSLKEVSPSYRSELTKKVRAFFEKYKAVSNNNPNDIEIVTQNTSFLDEQNELELEINNAKRLSRENYRNRESEILYLEDKLEEIEEEDKGYSYKKIARK